MAPSLVSTAGFVDLGPLKDVASRLEMRLDLRWRDAAARGARIVFFAEGQIRVFLYGEPTDMCRSFDGLQALTRHAMGHAPWMAAYYGRS